MTTEKIDLDIQTGEGCIERVHDIPNLSRLTSICRMPGHKAVNETLSMAIISRQLGGETDGKRCWYQSW